MCDKQETNSESEKDFFNKDNFKSCFARSVAVNSQYKAKPVDFFTESNGQSVEDKDTFTNKNSVNGSQEPPVRYRKNTRSASMDDSRRFSCGSIVSRRVSTVIPKRSEIPVENIYNQNKIETLQWQLKEIEKSREMYKQVMKEVVTFLEKAHTSLEYLGNRLNRKHSVPRSKSEHHIVTDSNSSQSQRSLIEEHLSSWNSTNKQDFHPDEIPPEKLSQEAFRLLRTTQSLLNTQEPKLASSENLSVLDEPSDIEFLTQLAREFRSDDQRPQRTTSFSLSPKLILPEHEIRISTAFNRKLSLQLSEVRRNSVGTGKFSRTDSARNSVAESEAYSLPPCIERLPTQPDPLRTIGTDCADNGSKNVEKTSSSPSPATTSISSMEDESGFSSMNSFQDVGLPLVNSTGIEEVSARSVLLKSMLHNNSDFHSLNDSEQSSCFSETTVIASPRAERRYEKRSEQKSRDSKRGSTLDDRRFSYANEERRNSLSDVKLWQKPYQNQPNGEEIVAEKKDNSHYNLKPQVNHHRWHSTPDKQSGSQSLKVLWV